MARFEPVNLGSSGEYDYHRGQLLIREYLI